MIAGLSKLGYKLEALNHSGWVEIFLLDVPFVTCMPDVVC